MFFFAALIASTGAADASGIVWIHDDWEQAKKAALATDRLVAIDVWATWCHTCLSMKNYALKEAPMAAVKDAHVFLALDYDKEKNAAFFEKHPAGALPTFMVIDPKTDTMVARWIGSGNSKEMAAFFRDAAKAKGSSLFRAQLASAEGDRAKARQIYEQALKTEKLDRAAKSRMVNGLADILLKDDPKACARQIAPYLDEVEDSAQGLDAVDLLYACTSKLEDPTEKRAILAKIAARFEKGTAGRSAQLAVDDVSAYLGSLVDIYDELGEKAKAEAALKKRVALLENAAKSAKNQDARATFDYHRMQAYLRLKRHDDAIAMLSASEKAQPKDFNHPWRLALVYLDKGEHAKGLAAIDRAIANGYGGRKMRLYSTKLDLLLAKKDLAGAKATVAQGRAYMAQAKQSQLRPAWKQEFEEKAKRVLDLDRKS